MPKCGKCNDTGVWETGNNDLPCDCPAGAAALFNVAGVIGPVTGGEMRRHFLNDSPQPIKLGAKDISASDLPGRKTLSLGQVLDYLAALSNMQIHSDRIGRYYEPAAVFGDRCVEIRHKIFVLLQQVEPDLGDIFGCSKSRFGARVEPFRQISSEVVAQIHEHLSGLFNLKNQD